MNAARKKHQPLEKFELDHDQRVKCTDIARRLKAAFVWSKSPEGLAYWDEVYERLIAHGVRLN